jgi:hypothetical protein
VENAAVVEAEIEVVLARFEARQREQLADLIAELRAATRATSSLQPPDHELDEGFRDLMPAADAAKIALRAKPTMRTWCGKHKINGEAGFARQIGSRWFVSKSRLLRHLASGSRD